MAMARLVVLLALLAALVATALAGSGRWATESHMKEHAEEIGADASEFKAGQEEVFFFTLFDANRDGFLDGHELRIALADSDAHEYTDSKLAELERTVDKLLMDNDRDYDGRLSLDEYLDAKTKQTI